MSDDEEIKTQTRKVKINVSRDAEVDSLHEDMNKLKTEKEELKANLARVTMENLEKEKDMISRLFPNDKDAIDVCPIEKWEDYKTTLFDRQGVPNKPKPQGKASMTAEFQGEKYDSHEQLVNALYAILDNPKTSKAEKAEANKKINELWKSTISGKSWNLLRRGGSINKILKPMTSCYECGYSYDSSKGPCTKCGYDPYKRQEIMTPKKWSERGLP